MNLDWYQILIETSASRARISGSNQRSGNQTIIHRSIWIKGWKNWESLVTTLMMQCALLKITKFSSLKNSNKDSFRHDCPWMSLLKNHRCRKIDVKCTLWKQRKDQKRIEAEQRHKDFENRNMFLEAERKLNSKHHDEYSAHYRSSGRYYEFHFCELEISYVIYDMCHNTYKVNVPSFWWNQKINFLSARRLNENAKKNAGMF